MKLEIKDTLISFGIQKIFDKNIIVEAIGKVTSLQPFKDIVIIEDLLKEGNVHSNARLYIDVIHKPAGFAILCNIGSPVLREHIPSVENFVKEMAKELDSNIFIDIGEYDGYLVKPDGSMEYKKFDTFLVDEDECLPIFD